MNSYRQTLKDLKQRILETTAKQIESSINSPGNTYHTILDILERNFHTYDVLKSPIARLDDTTSPK